MKPFTQAQKMIEFKPANYQKFAMSLRRTETVVMGRAKIAVDRSMNFSIPELPPRKCRKKR